MSHGTMNHPVLRAVLDGERVAPYMPGDVVHGSVYTTPSVTSWVHSTVTSHRVFDLRDRWAAVSDSLDHVEIEVMSGLGGRLTTADGEPVTDMFAAESRSTDLPLLAPPAVSVHGLYLINEERAALVHPGYFDRPAEETCVYLLKVIDGVLTMNISGAIKIEDGAWGVACSIGSLYNSDRWDAASKDERYAWLETKNRAGLTGLEVVDYALTACLTVLLVNSIVLADRTVVRTTSTPAKLRKANARRGRPTPLGTMWIDLPGLRYSGGHWRADSVGSGGVAWHQVRGFYRTLHSPIFKERQGTRVWVRPHTRGTVDKGVSANPYRMKA